MFSFLSKCFGYTNSSSKLKKKCKCKCCTKHTQYENELFPPFFHAFN